MPTSHSSAAAAAHEGRPESARTAYSRLGVFRGQYARLELAVARDRRVRLASCAPWPATICGPSAASGGARTGSHRCKTWRVARRRPQSSAQGRGGVARAGLRGEAKGRRRAAKADEARASARPRCWTAAAGTAGRGHSGHSAAGCSSTSRAHACGELVDRGAARARRCRQRRLTQLGPTSARRAQAAEDLHAHA